jgi:hypothetical protein
MEMKKSLDIYGQGFICIDDMVYLDEIDEYVTKEEYKDYVEYISKYNTNKD